MQGERFLKHPVLPLLLLIISVPILAGCPTTERRAYVALGGSYAAGAGGGDYEKSYASLFHAFLQEETEEQLSLRSLAVENETTASMIGDGQLAKALAELRFRNQDESPDNDTIAITLQIGGEEAMSLLLEDGPCRPPATLDDRECEAAFHGMLNEARLNVPAVLRALRVAAGPETDVLVINYFYPFPTAERSETGEELYSALNEILEEAARMPGVDATLVDIAGEFRGRTQELTAPLDEGGGRAPNEAGHALIASLLERALEK